MSDKVTTYVMVPILPEAQETLEELQTYKSLLSQERYQEERVRFVCEAYLKNFGKGMGLETQIDYVANTGLKP